MVKIELSLIEEASQRLRHHVRHTILQRSATFSKMTDGDIFLKYENLQKTGSFKLRGALNYIGRMHENGDKSSIISASAGNHAQGVAYAASLYGFKSTIIMPKTTPIAKIQATRNYGAEVILFGSSYDDAYKKAFEISKKQNSVFIHPYNDPDVIAGQGTIGIEMLSDMEDVDLVFVPVGGGGLIAGVACAIKQINPQVRIIGVQAEGANAVVQSFTSKKRVCTQDAVTIADGIRVNEPGKMTVDLINHYVDEMISVTDIQIADAILLLLERCKIAVEPAGAVSVAAVLNGKVDVTGKRVICLLSGGNIDVSLMENIIDRGLVARHRKIEFNVVLSDHPGELVDLMDVIVKEGANILSMTHKKIIEGLNPDQISVNVVCEVAGKSHYDQLIGTLKAMNYHLQ